MTNDSGKISSGMKATLTNYRQAPRKIRLVTSLVAGKRVSEALTALKFLEKRAARPIAKLIMSAAANAEKQGENAQELYVQAITVGKGIVLKRSMPRAFGRSAPIRHRLSHVTVTLAQRTTHNAQHSKKKSDASRSALRAAQ